MKRVSIILFILCLGVAVNSFSQTTTSTTATSLTAPSSTDFFAGKWEIAVAGTPMGDVKFLTDLVRKNGTLTGELADASDPAKPKRPLTKVEEKGDKLSLYFESSQGGEMTIDLTKVDDNNLKGTLYNFDATAKRVK